MYVLTSAAAQPGAPLRSLVITGELKSKIDRIWAAFWSGGISDPLEVIEQITHLLFNRRLHDLQIAAENKARCSGQPLENPILQPEGREGLTRDV